MPIAYYNGQFVPAAGLAVPIHDAGLVWGATVTDRTRTYLGRPFRLLEHLRRFQSSCERAQVPLAVGEAELVQASERLVAENYQSDDLSILWLATPGPLDPFAPEPSPAQAGPTLIGYTIPVPTVAPGGARLVPVCASLGTDRRIKHRSRLPWWIAAQRVRNSHPEATPLFFDSECFVLETPSANFVAVIDGVVVTPPPEAVLGGITLKFVLRICRDWGVPTASRPIPLAEVAQASEAWLTNSTYGVIGVATVGEVALPYPGTILSRLHNAWIDLIEADIQTVARAAR